MKATIPALGALLLAGLVCPLAQAQYYYPPQVFGGARPPAPDACGPGFYDLNWCGCPYGPNYCLRPPWEPFNGLRPCLPGQGGAPGAGGLPPVGSFPMLPGRQGGPPPIASFPTHPFARSPRDFFMWTETLEDQAMRARLPVLAP
jgi:hypothetical protein